ncbi:MAG: rhodanese-like domain-containing protein [Marinibacterium sp.]
MTFTRRKTVALLSALPLLPVATMASAKEDRIWTAQQAYEALSRDEARLIDIRSRGEWEESGVAQGAWPVSMHEKGFPKRLFAAQELAEGRPVAMICATGGRTASVMAALKRAGYEGFIDVSEGMMGSRKGKGWIASGLPVVSAKVALADLPAVLV